MIKQGGKSVEEQFHDLTPEEKAKYLDLSTLEKLTGYTIPLTDHDYAAGTPVMLNALYKEKKLP